MSDKVPAGYWTARHFLYLVHSMEFLTYKEWLEVIGKQADRLGV